jgi:hypothetical protein
MANKTANENLPPEQRLCSKQVRTAASLVKHRLQKNNVTHDICMHRCHGLWLKYPKACAIQYCLARRNLQQNACQEFIEAWEQCRDKARALDAAKKKNQTNP